MNLKLHPEHGVNPALDCCFWCGKEIGVALMGWNGGNEAPRRTVTSYAPCGECKENFAKGVVCIEAETTPVYPGQPSILPGKADRAAYPTGRHVVISREAVERVFTPKGAAEMLTAGRALFAPDVFGYLFTAAKKGD
jgi:hypothetical protein